MRAIVVAASVSAALTRAGSAFESRRDSRSPASSSTRPARVSASPAAASIPRRNPVRSTCERVCRSSRPRACRYSAR